MEFYALSVNFLEKLPAQGGIFLFSAFSALPLPLPLFLSFCTLLSPWPFNKSTAVFRPIPPLPSLSGRLCASRGVEESPGATHSSQITAATLATTSKGIRGTRTKRKTKYLSV